MTLKEKLLNLNIVVDNEYLDKYCELIESNRETKKEKFKTQCHHIIPKYYYKLNDLELDDSRDNKVNLIYKDHILGHYYLLKCSSCDEYRQRNAIMIHLVIGNLEDTERESVINNELNNYQYIYENYRNGTPKLSEETKRKIGEANKVSLKGHKLSQERKEQLRQRNIGRTFYNNGERNIFIDKDQEVPEGFVKGMIITSISKDEWMTKVHSNRKPEDYNTTGGTIVINNGKVNKHIKEEDLDKYLSEGWNKGKLPLGKLMWYNNGIKNTRAYECPEGYVKGRLYK